MGILHVVRNGRLDPPSGRQFDRSGAASSPMKLTLCTHVSHTKPFFDPELTRQEIEDVSMSSVRALNACVQPWLLNKLIGPYRISKILATIRQSREGSMILLRRLAGQGQDVLDITEVDVQLVECRTHLLLPESLEALRCCCH